MNFQQLEKIAEKYIAINYNEFPANAFELARKLNLRVKNSIECKKDFKDKYPLYNCNAVYALVNGEYTIYYDEKYVYKNFSVAHEIAHHLLEHHTDGAREHHDANLLAAILLLPPKKVIKHKIKNAIDLSEKYLIPYNVACEYWVEIKDVVIPKNVLKNKFTYLVFGIILTATIIIGITYYTIKGNNRQVLPPVISQTTDTNDVVYITKYAKKYHKKDCFSLSNSNIIQVDKNDAINCGYEPCGMCIK